MQIPGKALSFPSLQSRKRGNPGLAEPLDLCERDRHTPAARARVRAGETAWTPYEDELVKTGDFLQVNIDRLGPICQDIVDSQF